MTRRLLGDIRLTDTLLYLQCNAWWCAAEAHGRNPFCKRHWFALPVAVRVGIWRHTHGTSARAAAIRGAARHLDHIIGAAA